MYLLNHSLFYENMPLKPNESVKILNWLQSEPTFEELCAEFPHEWEVVQQELSNVFSHGKAEDLNDYLKQLSNGGGEIARDYLKRRGDKISDNADLMRMIRYRMAHSSIKRHYNSVATGIERGKVRFNLLNGLVTQKLLFSEGLVRKPVSMSWFKIIWPLIWQKRLLMPLVQPEGIYCFYSKELVAALCEIIGSRVCLEIAAGDGTLSRFLAQGGVRITATDDYSWTHTVKYNESVIKRDAKEALSIYSPEVVICSWPPANNKFEKLVFKTRSVQVYIVIGSRHQFASGNWGDYKNQTSFAFEEDKRLSRLVLPPELDSVVYIFRRNS